VNSVLLAMLCSVSFAASAAEFTIQRGAAAITVKDGPTAVLRYNTQRPPNTKLPVDSGGFFHPVTTPSGIVMTEVAPADHVHHRGIFLAWVEMHGAKDGDFWGWGEHAPIKGRMIVNRNVRELPRERGIAAFRAQNEWLAEGTVMIEETLEASIKADSNAYVIDLQYTLTPAADTTLARWAFSGFCVRLRKDGKLQAYGPDGPVAFKNPIHTQPESDWPDAAWYDYTLTLDDGKVAGVAVMNHPRNPPTLWHNHRDVRMLNPSIVAPARVQMKAHQPMILRYRVVVHDGPVPRELLTRLKFT
jgi:hypothetical protein